MRQGLCVAVWFRMCASDILVVRHLHILNRETSDCIHSNNIPGSVANPLQEWFTKRRCPIKIQSLGQSLSERLWRTLGNSALRNPKRSMVQLHPQVRTAIEIWPRWYNRTNVYYAVSMLPPVPGTVLAAYLITDTYSWGLNFRSTVCLWFQVWQHNSNIFIFLQESMK